MAANTLQDHAGPTHQGVHTLAQATPVVLRILLPQGLGLRNVGLLSVHRCQEDTVRHHMFQASRLLRFAVTLCTTATLL